MEGEADRLHYAEGLRLAGIRERDLAAASAPAVLRAARDRQGHGTRTAPDPPAVTRDNCC